MRSIPAGSVRMRRDGVSYFNREGYADSTAYKAITNIMREREKERYRTMNQWSGIGTIMKDPKISTTKNGDTYMRLVVNIPRKIDGVCDYISVRLGTRLTESFLGKIAQGDLVGVSGRLQTWVYLPEDGIKRFGYEILAEEINLMNSDPSQLPIPERSGATE